MIFSNNVDQSKIYQLRIILKNVSPLIWRKILVADSTSIADLHDILQIILQWGDYHLNQFIIHGKSYGVYHDGGMSFSDNPRCVTLKDFRFRLNEKFQYEYNFTDGWEYEIRFEKIVPLNPKIKYPHCLGGNRLAPPEDCGGPLAFLELDRHYDIFQIQAELNRLVKRHVQDEDIAHYEFEDYDDDGAMHRALVLLAARHTKDMSATNFETLEPEDDDDDFDLWCTREVYDYDINNFADGVETLNYWYHKDAFNRSKINNLLETKFNVNIDEVNHAS